MFRGDFFQEKDKNVISIQRFKNSFISQTIVSIKCGCFTILAGNLKMICIQKNEDIFVKSFEKLMSMFASLLCTLDYAYT